MKLKLRVWRQKDSKSQGQFVDYTLEGVSEHASFLEMLDILNEDLIKKGQEAIEFDNDCREGICGSCSMVIDGQAHGPDRGVATCQVHMRHYRDGDAIVIEPWRAKAFPVIKDLVVDRGALDRIIAAGGYISTKTGPHPEPNSLPVNRTAAEKAMDAAACIGCGACVAACPNASASLFTAAKISHLALLPQGKIESQERAMRMVEQMDKEGFGHCTNIGECEAACPKEISIENIARMKREYLKGVLTSAPASSASDFA